jgi:ketosteroid isomerase-like protein
MRRSARWLIALLFTAAIARPIAAQAGTSSNPSDRARILQLEESWAVALVKRDLNTFKRLLAPGFIYTEDDRLMNREAVLKEVATGDTVTASHNEDMVVHLFGTTAVVTGLLHVEGRAKGAPWVHRYRFTDTWVRQRSGVWQIVAAQDYLVPAKR